MAQWNSGMENLAGVLMVGRGWEGKKREQRALANMEMLFPYLLSNPLF